MPNEDAAAAHIRGVAKLAVEGTRSDLVLNL
jgi:hypothetical protein